MSSREEKRSQQLDPGTPTKKGTSTEDGKEGFTAPPREMPRKSNKVEDLTARGEGKWAGAPVPEDVEMRDDRGLVGGDHRLGGERPARETDPDVK